MAIVQPFLQRTELTYRKMTYLDCTTLKIFRYHPLQRTQQLQLTARLVLWLGNWLPRNPSVNSVWAADEMPTRVNWIRIMLRVFVGLGSTRTTGADEYMIFYNNSTVPVFLNIWKLSVEQQSSLPSNYSILFQHHSAAHRPNVPENASIRE
ncbi:hypothetical protein SFRURICE_008599 [Spodoptera frugiperda]|nr:hypothetical protein SFRURICE_008599 [Spodoptera frugiperda]